MAAWRARGADPVRLRHVEALARRALRHEGATRQLLDDRLRQLLASRGEAPAWNPGPVAQLDAALPLPPPRRGALTELLEHIAKHTVAATAGSTAAAGPFSPAPELKAVRD